jgi:hypothetical protein
MGAEGLACAVESGTGVSIACADEDELTLRSAGRGGLLLGWADAG